MTRLVHGHLMYKSCIPVCNCVVKEVGELFPIEDDAARVGFIDMYDDDLDLDASIDLLE